MRGIISSAKMSQSGKTLSVNIGGTWYSTKLKELEKHVGAEIVAETSDSEYNGQVIHWVNSYSLVDGSPAPSPNEVGPGNSKGLMSHYQPMISNLAAALIAAGKEPDELSAWFHAAKFLLEGKSDEVPY